MALSRRVRIGLWIAAGVFGALAAIVWILIVRFQPVARQYVISTLRERYKSEVELGNFQISLFPFGASDGRQSDTQMGRAEGFATVDRNPAVHRGSPVRGLLPLSEKNSEVDAGGSAVASSPEIRAAAGRGQQ